MGNTPAWLPALLGLLTLVGAGGGIWSAFTVGSTKRKLVADAAQVNASTAIDLSKAAQEWTEPLRARVRELEEEVNDLRRQMRAARAQSEEAEFLRTRIDLVRAECASLREQLAEKDRLLAEARSQRQPPSQLE